MKPVTEEMRFEWYAWHLCEQTDAMVDDFKQSETEREQRETLHRFLQFTMTIRVPEFVAVIRQRFMFNTGVRG